LPLGLWLGFGFGFLVSITNYFLLTILQLCVKSQGPQNFMCPYEVYHGEDQQSAAAYWHEYFEP